MVVCDVCKKPLEASVKVFTGLKAKPEYELCGKCYNKMVKYLKFETARKEAVKNRRIARRLKK